MELFVCPVCEFEGLAEPPFTDGEPSYEECTRCGTHFGFDDEGLRGAELERRWNERRQAWLASGRRPVPGSSPTPASPAPQRAETGLRASEVQQILLEVKAERHANRWRVRRYLHNLGWPWALYNMLIIPVGAYVAFTTGGPVVGSVICLMYVVGFGLPRLMLEHLFDHMHAVFRSLSILRYAIMAVFVLHLTNSVDFPALLWLFLIPVLGFMNGCGFWVMSDRRIYVDR